MNNTRSAEASGIKTYPLIITTAMGINSMMNNIRVDVAFFSKVVRLILLTFLLTGITFAHAAWHPIDIQDERVLLDPPHIYRKEIRFTLINRPDYLPEKNRY
ncbi:hypothetical protein [Erwinia sp. MYb535]|uniref:hypothetical protein n=1 Tax=Erwinia sp. MYb535 TaxID=2745309 RepID=UPI0030A60AD8